MIGTIKKLTNKDGNYILPVTSSKAIYMEDGITLLEDKILGLVLGAGADGIQGEQGIQGLQGIPGTKGDTGTQGTTGTAGTKGDTGTQGVKGTTGTAGTNGVDGTDGTSTMTILVKTQAEYDALASTKLTDGILYLIRG